MATRVLLILAGAVGVIGLAYLLLSLFAFQSVENGVSHHVIAGGGVLRGVFLLLVALVLGLIAFAVR
ncbi:MAG TPA: hypothetical protein VKQ36_17655 [Ktedonobacterales bacterium]|nr:hypothetical protein [Ktedonobacterales bacterium]